MIKKVVSKRKLGDPEENPWKGKTGIELMNQLNFLINNWFNLDTKSTSGHQRNIVVTKRKFN